MIPPSRVVPAPAGGTAAVLLAITVTVLLAAAAITLAAHGWRWLAARKLTAETEEHLRDQAGVA